MAKKVVKKRPVTPAKMEQQDRQACRCCFGVPVGNGFGLGNGPDSDEPQELLVAGDILSRLDSRGLRREFCLSAAEEAIRNQQKAFRAAAFGTSDEADLDGVPAELLAAVDEGQLSKALNW